MRFTFYSTVSITALLANEMLVKSVDAVALETAENAFDTYMYDYDLAEVAALSEEDFSDAEMAQVDAEYVNT